METKNGNNCIYSCAKCKYNAKKKHTYDKHLLTERHLKKIGEYGQGSSTITTKSTGVCEARLEDFGTDSVDEKSYRTLLDEQYVKAEALQKQVDELKNNNSMLITKMLELTEKYLNLQNEQTKTVNNVTNNTVNNNQIYNINVYFNKGLMEIQSNMVNPDTNTTVDFTDTIPIELSSSLRKDFAQLCFNTSLQSDDDLDS